MTSEESFGPVIVYEGDIGEGSTLGAVIHIIESNPKKVISNTKLNIPNYRPLVLSRIVNIPKYLPNSTIFIDNSDIVITSRRTASKINKLWSYILSSFRKLDVRVILTLHRFEGLDKRIRNSVTDRVRCSIPEGTRKLKLEHYKLLEGEVWIRSYLDEDNNWIKAHWETKLVWTLVSTCILKRTNKYFKYYNTLEIIKLEDQLDTANINYTKIN